MLGKVGFSSWSFTPGRAHSTRTHALLLTHHTHSIELASRHSALVRLLPSYRRRRSPSSPSFRCERWQQSLAFRAPPPSSPLHLRTAAQQRWRRDTCLFQQIEIIKYKIVSLLGWLPNQQPTRASARNFIQRQLLKVLVVVAVVASNFRLRRVQRRQQGSCRCSVVAGLFLFLIELWRIIKDANASVSNNPELNWDEIPRVIHPAAAAASRHFLFPPFTSLIK